MQKVVPNHGSAVATLTSTDHSNLNIFSIAVSGAGAARFTETNDCAHGLVPGAPCAISVNSAIRVEPMRLVRVLSPDTEAGLIAIVEKLEACEIPCFVRNAGCNAASFGVRGRLSKPRIVMVPAERVAEAIKLIGNRQDSRAAHGDLARNTWFSKLRALVKLGCLLWFARVLHERGLESRSDDVAEDRSTS